MHCIRQLRLFLAQQEHEVQQTFFYHAATHKGDALRVRGPAGALRYNLNNLNLGLDRHGKILVDGFVTLHVLTSPLEQIQGVVSQAWLEMLPDEISTRKDWVKAPLIDEVETKRLLATFPLAAQKTLGFEITGAYQTAKQKVKWTNQEQPLCPHCQEEDSVEHRRLWCPALQLTRNEHLDIVHELWEMNPIVVTLPVIYQHHLTTLERCLAWRAPRMQPNEHILGLIREQIDHGHRPLIFTDGSAAPPDIPSLRKAAFAIVYLPWEAESNPQRIVEDFLHQQIVPQAFCTVGIARTQGMQTIPRSELQAAVEVVLHIRMAEIVTDSQYVLDSVEKIRAGMTSPELCNHPNGDLLLELQKCLDDPARDYLWTKLRSHQTDIRNQPLRDQLFAVGNEAADVAAKEARKILADNTTFLTKEEILDSRDLQKRQFELAVALNRQRTKLEAASTAKTQENDLETEQILHVEVA